MTHAKNLTGHTYLCLCILFVRFDDSIQFEKKKKKFHAILAMECAYVNRAAKLSD